MVYTSLIFIDSAQLVRFLSHFANLSASTSLILFSTLSSTIAIRSFMAGIFEVLVSTSSPAWTFFNHATQATYFKTVDLLFSILSKQCSYAFPTNLYCSTCGISNWFLLNTQYVFISLLSTSIFNASADKQSLPKVSSFSVFNLLLIRSLDIRLLTRLP